METTDAVAGHTCAQRERNARTRIDTTAGPLLCRLTVVNVTGIVEERGFRLFWEPVDGSPIRVPALGLATSSPFPTERAARAHGVRLLGERPVRRPS